MKVSVALCTYNGAAYLGEQLESIRLQARQPGELVIYDDGSSDRTAEIIRDFAKRALFPVRFLVNQHRLGVIKNFERAISEAKGEYVALCDQDDVWHPDKLASEMTLMEATEREVGSNVPVLVHSDLRVVSATRELIHDSLFAYQKLAPTQVEPINRLLVQNFVTGCTVIVNRALVNVALPISPQAVMHDWWLALCAAVYGEIRTLRRATVDYRQHTANQVGAAAYWRHAVQRLWENVVADRAKATKSFSSMFRAKVEQALALESHVQARMRGMAHTDAVESLGCFAKIFSSGSGCAGRLIHALSCSVRSSTTFRQLNYLVRVALWQPSSEER